MCWVSVKATRGEPSVETDCDAFLFSFGYLSVRPVLLQRLANWIVVR